MKHSRTVVWTPSDWSHLKSGMLVRSYRWIHCLRGGGTIYKAINNGLVVRVRVTAMYYEAYILDSEGVFCAYSEFNHFDWEEITF